VNPVYSKMPVEKVFMQSRDATVDLCNRETRKMYQKLAKSGFLLQIKLYQEITRKKEEELTRKLEIVWYRWEAGIGIDGIVNENPDTGSIKRIVIEWIDVLSSSLQSRACSASTEDTVKYRIKGN
jgi:hypothetical protein